MTTFAANISMLFKDRPFLDRPSVAKTFGFDAIEMRWPDSDDLAGATLDDLVDQVRTSAVTTVLMNLDAGSLGSGDRGLAGDPARTDRFRANVPVALAAAKAMGGRKLCFLVGNRIESISRVEQVRLVADNAAFAADAAAAQGMVVVVEPINAVENPRYLLSSTADVLDLIRDVDRPNLRLLLDIYHCAMNGEDVLETIRTTAPWIGHVQLADVPGRHEPGSGELPIRAILETLAASGYRDPIGLEYLPSDVAADPLAFLATIAAGDVSSRIEPAG